MKDILEAKESRNLRSLSEFILCGPELIKTERSEKIDKYGNIVQMASQEWAKKNDTIKIYYEESSLSCEKDRKDYLVEIEYFRNVKRADKKELIRIWCVSFWRVENNSVNKGNMIELKVSGLKEEDAKKLKIQTIDLLAFCHIMHLPTEDIEELLKKDIKYIPRMYNNICKY